MNILAAAAAAKSLQSCPTLCNPIDSSPPGSPIPGILQARTLEWVAISFSNAWKWKAKVKSLSRVRLLVTPWTAAYQAPPSMGFSRQEYWSGLPLPSLSSPEYPTINFSLKFLGCPVVRAWSFHCSGPGVQFLGRELRSCKPHQDTKKKEKKVFFLLHIATATIFSKSLCLLVGPAIVFLFKKKKRIKYNPHIIFKG